MKIGHIKLIKKINRELVLDMIRNEQPISRSKLSRNLGMSRSTVSSIVNQLISKKFVSELGYTQSTKEGGRPAIQLGFNPTSGFGLGVDITSEQLIICIADLDGNIVYTSEVSFTGKLPAIRDAIVDSIKKSHLPIEKIISIGFCIPGLTNSKLGLVADAPELQWKNVNLIEYMQTYFDQPLFINNNVNCKALSERWLGNAKDLDDFIYVSVKKGIGTAIIANGKLIQGKDFMAGEIGYFALESNLKTEEMYTLGEFGTFDKKASIIAFGENSEAFDQIVKNFPHLKDNQQEQLNEFIKHLSLGLANMISLLNPEKVIISGEIGSQLTFIKDKIVKQVEHITPMTCTFEITEMNNFSGPLGIISLSFSEVMDTII